ncbi:hypothetical protein VPH35_101464 [Triticum aestivum]
MDELALPPPLHLPHLPDDMLVEILLRLPPEPIHLFCASFVSKHWRSLVHDARFLRRFREFHVGMPPVLGFFSNRLDHSLFVPTSGGFALSAAAKMSHRDWWALDCRHGRALLEKLGSRTLLVWDLVTGDRRYLPLPPACKRGYNGAVLRAAGHADCHCHRCPFLVVYVFRRPNSAGICASVWSSETGVWSETTVIIVPYLSVVPEPSTLVGNKLYWLLENSSILEYDLDHHGLGLIHEMPYDALWAGKFLLMPAEDGRLGLAGVERHNLHLWSLIASIDGRVTWTHQRVIDLGNFLGPEVAAKCIYGIGFAQDAGVIFIHMHATVYMIHLKSMQIKEVSEKGLHICGDALLILVSLKFPPQK